MGIADGKLLFCHGTSEEIVDKRTPTIDYNNRTVYECFNNPFTADFVSPVFNIPPITIDNRTNLQKIYHYTPNMIPDVISVAYENSVGTLINFSDSPRIFLLPSDNTYPPHAMKKDDNYRVKMTIGYCFREITKNNAIEIRGYIAPRALIKTRIFITVMGFPGLI